MIVIVRVCKKQLSRTGDTYLTLSDITDVPGAVLSERDN